VTVKLNGAIALRASVTATTWTTYTSAVPVPAGTHGISVSFTNDHQSSTCDRNLRVDAITLPLAATAPAPTPGPGPVSAPVITAQSGAVTIAAGQATTLSVTATGATSYQWQNDGYGVWGSMGGATAPTFATGPMTLSRNYRVAVTNAGGTVYSYPIPVTVTVPAPVITAHSGGVTIPSGQATTLSVTATGATSYQWQNDGYGVWGSMGGATAPTFATGPMTVSRNYRVAVSNTTGTVHSYPIPVTVTAPTAGDPFEGRPLYVMPDTPARRQANDWRASRPGDAATMDRLAATPTAKWFGGSVTTVAGDVDRHVSAARATNTLPVIVAYNIPQRDCGQFSAGGANSPDGYRAWTAELARGIGDRPAAVILEPDALAGIDCLNAADQATRYALLSDAVNTLEARPGVSVYIDAGNPGWVPADQMANRLNAAGINRSAGFALNTSNYHDTDFSTRYARDLSGRVGGKHAVIDTSRNGAGSNGEWCNPTGRALGTRPTANTTDPTVDAYLWIKTPGESDGACNGGPSAGAWWPDYALGLAHRASF
jgi:endoglucanase